MIIIIITFLYRRTVVTSEPLVAVSLIVCASQTLDGKVSLV